MSAKSISEVKIWWLSSIDKINPRSLDLMTLWSWLHKLLKPIPEVLIWWFIGPGVRCRHSQFGSLDLMTFWPWFQKSTRSKSRSSDLMTFWPWLQKWTTSIPEVWIWWVCGPGSRSRLNQYLKFWFDEIVALSPEVGKISPRSHDLMIFWLGSKKSTTSFLWLLRGLAPDVLI